jgi:hypothetical protein
MCFITTAYEVYKLKSPVFLQCVMVISEREGMKQGTSVHHIENFTTELKTVVDKDKYLILCEISTRYFCWLWWRCIKY